MLTSCSNGSAPLDRMAAMFIYGKSALKSSSPVLRMIWGWILVYSIGDSRSTKFVKMMRQGWPLTVLWYGQRICVPVVVAILEYCCIAFANMQWRFYQVSELWPILHFYMQTAFAKFSFASAHSDQPFLLGDLLYSSHADNKVGRENCANGQECWIHLTKFLPFYERYTIDSCYFKHW